MAEKSVVACPAAPPQAASEQVLNEILRKAFEQLMNRHFTDNILIPECVMWLLAAYEMHRNTLAVVNL